jgi:uncharacterized pyridoxal phosphate-containing UPF0001 family protein
MSDLAVRVRKRVQRLEDAIGRILADSGRTDRIRIVGVVKGRSPAEAWALYEAGISHLAENRWEALSEKEDDLRSHDACDPRMHFIGALQRRSLKSGYRPVARIDTVDRESVVPVLAERARVHGVRQEVLVEIDLTGIPGRSGVRPDGLESLMDAVGKFPVLKGVGFLVMGPPPERTAETVRVFEEGRRLFDRYYGGDGVLSMGMTDDYPAAIRAGSTEIRLGRYFFEPEEKESE